MAAIIVILLSGAAIVSMMRSTADEKWVLDPPKGKGNKKPDIDLDDVADAFDEIDLDADADLDLDKPKIDS